MGRRKNKRIKLRSRDVIFKVVAHVDWYMLARIIFTYISRFSMAWKTVLGSYQKRDFLNKLRQEKNIPMKSISLKSKSECFTLTNIKYHVQVVN